MTSAVCEVVFEKIRTTKRARKWTLEAMFAFWIAVVTRAPASLRRTLEECAEDSSVLGLTSATSSFFERAQKLKWGFFGEIFVRFIDAVVPECMAGFESRLRARLASFPEVWIVDGSGLDRVPKRLKVLRDVGVVVLPGSVTACYAPFRGIPRIPDFYGQLVHSEAARLEELLDRIPRGTLLVENRRRAAEPTPRKEGDAPERLERHVARSAAAPAPSAPEMSVPEPSRGPR